MIASVIPASPINTFTQGVMAARHGQRQQAHELLVQATEQTPENVAAWLWRAGTASTREETLLCLSTALRLDPTHAAARQALHQALSDELAEDVFLAYGSEDEWLYYIRNGAGVPVAVPKDRAAPEPYPPLRYSSLHLAERWLALAILGLIPAGLGALVCAPVAVAYAWRRPGKSLSSLERRWRMVLLGLALLIWLLGGLLVWLLLLHF
jgi:hypothetical protein